MPAGLRGPALPTQFIARIIVPGTMSFASLRFSPLFVGHFFARPWNPLKRWTSPIPEPRQRVDCGPRFDFPPICRRPSRMTITAAHIPAIVALLAGVLILIMPRFLNFIIAIYLILVGLHGLGFLRMFHM